MADARCRRCGGALPPGGGCARCLLALGLSEGLTPQTGPAPSSVDPGLEVSERIGPYRVLDAVGSGGVGAVSLAEQEEPVRRRVALKIVRPGLASVDVLGRFEAERQVLALLDHPGIAKVFDSGSAEDGRPWVAMEWVPGVPITEHCDRERLTLRQRLLLFVEVCDAIQHAHTRGVLHRAIKPSNVLVTDVDGRPRPKVVDFGVAVALGPKVTEQTLYTALGTLVGTPGYMSPEQTGPAPLEVEARSDVYSLGVLLYELLVGGPPFDPRRLRKAGWAGLVRIIRTEVPSRPSARVSTLARGTVSEAAFCRRLEPASLARELRGDLDAIVQKALEKDPGQRYASVAELASDVQRHLGGERVTAAPRSPWERLPATLRNLWARAARPGSH